MNELDRLRADLEHQETRLREGGGEAGQVRQRRLGRLNVRERLAELLDPDAPFLELGLWQAWNMYPEWGDVPAAGVVTGIGRVAGRAVLVVANDATVKAGAFFPQSVKKVLRAQRVGGLFRLPILYLVDSAGVFLPLQDEIFPDEDDFGRIFRNNAVLSAEGVPQYAAVMGNCVAGGAYLPVLCDKLLMTEGSQMCLAGPSLVKAAIGQEADPEQLGGAAMHAGISGTVDFHEPDDRSCLRRLRTLVGMLDDPRTLPNASGSRSSSSSSADGTAGCDADRRSARAPRRDPRDVYGLVSDDDGPTRYDARELLDTIVDAGSLEEYKAEYGPTVVTSLARIDGRAVGIVANQTAKCRTASGEMQIGGVLYCDSVNKAARFVLDCNQTGLPLIFLQDVQGFMVGTQAEQSGIIRSGAKLVNAVSNSIVPKLTVIVGGSFGAGNYALCGKAYDPWLILAWPGAKYAVMGAAQAAATLLDLKVRDAERGGRTLSPDERQQMRDDIERRYQQQTDVRHAAARGWVDAVIPPHRTRDWLAEALRILPPAAERRGLRNGVIQV